MQNRNFFYTLLVISFVVFFYAFFLDAPKNFPLGTIFKIEQGNTLRNVSLRLKNEHIISSRLIFEAFVIFLGGDKRVVSTNYYFENKIPVWSVARRISKGENHMAPIMVTIPEGFDNGEIANVFDFKLPLFDKEKFLREAKGLQGKLFPDTYFFLSTDDEGAVLTSMLNNFNKKLTSLRPLITMLGKKEKDIIIMASLVEKESKGDADREFISGILWKRFSIGMPLQVDVALETYKVKGLPSDPIANPGLESLKSAISPKASPYLYYLHDKAGNVHYAKNFSEHEANIRKYLK